MAFDQAAALTALNTILNDNADVTFTSSQKTRALTRAWNDAYVTNHVFDSSLAYSTGTYQYPLPATLTTVEDIYISPTGSTQPFPDPIDASLYEIVNGKIQFNWKANTIIPNGYTLYIKGKYKLTTADSISDVNTQEYVLALAGVETLKYLAHQKANLFTKNDISMAELIGLKRDLQSDVINLRKTLRRSWESA